MSNWRLTAIRRTATTLALAIAVAAGSLAGSARTADETQFAARSDDPRTLVIASVTDLDFMRPLIEAFQRINPDIAVTYLEDTSNNLDSAVTDACTEGRFIADLVISSSIAQQVRLVNNGCAAPVLSPVVEALPDWAKWRGELFGLTFEPAVIVYNKAAFEGEEPPQSRFDLIDLMRQSGRFDGRVATYDIEQSGVGYLFAFQDAAEASTWGRLMEGFGRNNVRTFCCSGDIINLVAEGQALIGYNVLGSYALSRALTDPRIGVVLPSDYTLVLARAGFVPRPARDPLAARAFLELVLSAEGRAILNGDTRLLTPLSGPAALTAINQDEETAFRPIPLSPALLVSLDRAKRSRFLSQWRKSVIPPNP